MYLGLLIMLALFQLVRYLPGDLCHEGANLGQPLRFTPMEGETAPAIKTCPESAGSLMRPVE